MHRREHRTRVVEASLVVADASLSGVGAIEAAIQRLNAGVDAGLIAGGNRRREVGQRVEHVNRIGALENRAAIERARDRRGRIRRRWHSYRCRPDTRRSFRPSR